VTTDTADIAGFQRVRGTAIKLRLHTGMAAETTFFPVVLHERLTDVIVNLMTGRAGKISPIVNIGCSHGRLMNGYVTAAADLHLAESREFRYVGDTLLRWIVKMALPTVVATDAADVCK
jgi:hypothetical protein